MLSSTLQLGHCRAPSKVRTEDWCGAAAKYFAEAPLRLWLPTNPFPALLLVANTKRFVKLAIVDGVPAGGIFGIDLRELPVPSDLLVNIFGLGLHPSLDDWVGANDRC